MEGENPCRRTIFSLACNLPEGMGKMAVFGQGTEKKYGKLPGVAYYRAKKRKQKSPCFHCGTKAFLHKLLSGFEPLTSSLPMRKERFFLFHIMP